MQVTARKIYAPALTNPSLLVVVLDERGQVNTSDLENRHYDPAPTSRVERIRRASNRITRTSLTPSTMMQCVEDDLTIQTLAENSAPGSEVQSCSVNGSAPSPRGTQTTLTARMGPDTIPSPHPGSTHPTPPPQAFAGSHLFAHVDRLSPASGFPGRNAAWHPLNPMYWHF
ncbi:uncharacterized protein BO95DRAFT_4644 [Aspergillus brunneoviolaceus CBS 621.78]|uniref:Uncharacterized protein n=1 Tax=Aspergillus brunneoviolaceus CBS 621.78 TaxID=1450534 RepID=A0ACD1GQ36_9EURO|nr:hypothetical protein BO95DRAFT_4644 [Aspergillus brunneoviolaceus CBS 621.78]RAH51479.1 hypothetical protein BO95DRAFT_4644 [Aspergillus brunneoviolaceus CBS 621.78]